MNSLKKILFPLFSLFLGYRTFELMKLLLNREPADCLNFATVIYAFLITLYVTGIFAFIGFVYSSSMLLPAWYYEIKRPRTLNTFGKILGVKYFKALLLFAFWGRGSNREKYFNGTKKGLNNFILQTKQSEFGHIGAFVVITVLAVILLLNNHYGLVAIITLINVIGNVYPVILQRQHRLRVDSILKNSKPYKD